MFCNGPKYPLLKGLHPTNAVPRVSPTPQPWAM
ncbi:hypothetical protein EBZ35_04730 [bacterium]|nr:hypothetical protein [bacterium]